jgi:hypothetical protein
MRADDDEALSWDEVSDPTHTASPAAATVVEPVETPTEPTEAKPVTSSALLVTYGILGGAYLLYTIGWVLSVLNDNRIAYADLLSEVMYQFGEFLAIASPALWFVTVLTLTRGRKPIVRLLGLLLGLAVVIPWPFVLLGAGR